MTTFPSLSSQHLEHLDRIYKKLGGLPNNEASFVQMESLFYDTLSIAHTYGNTPFLFNLKSLEADHYIKAQQKTLTSRMRISAIRRFKNLLRQQINEALKKLGNPIN